MAYPMMADSSNPPPPNHAVLFLKTNKAERCIFCMNSLSNCTSSLNYACLSLSSGIFPSLLNKKNQILSTSVHASGYLQRSVLFFSLINLLIRLTELMIILLSSSSGIVYSIVRWDSFYVNYFWTKISEMSFMWYKEEISLFMRNSKLDKLSL